MLKYSFIITFIAFIFAGNILGQTSSKLDMFGPSALSLTYDKNIILNGYFSTEYAGWSFDKGSGGYHIRYDGISDPGDIQVGSNPATFNRGGGGAPGFDSYGDHTTGTGNFLMVDGRCKAIYIKLWEQKVNIKPNTYYYFSIWVSSLKNNPNHPGVLIFNIAGQSIGVNIQAPYKSGAVSAAEGGGWFHYETMWFSKNIEGNVLISIENNNSETCDSEVDFGIDDLELRPVKENITNTAKIKKRESILFATASDRIDSNYFNYLNQLVKELLKNPTFRLYLKGYTDNRDDFESNVDLSKRRSISVKNYLVSKGVPLDRISTNGFGETLPVETNDTIEGRKQNRRTEIYIIQ